MSREGNPITMPGALSRRSLFRIGGAAAAAGIGVSVPQAAQAQETWYSALVQPGADGKLVYVPEPVSRKIIPDFSWAGYRNGEAPIPDLPVVKEIGPLANPQDDATAHIQAALDEVGALVKDPVTGLRGALLLTAGVYPVAGTLYMTRSGVVLRGVGRDPDTGTVIRSTATKGTEAETGGVECPLWVGGRSGGWETRKTGTATDVVESVPAGSRRLKLASTTPFKVGDNIVIWHRCSQDWIDAVDGGGGSVPWNEGDEPIVYNRYITSIEEDGTIVIDAPVFNDLDISLTHVFVYVWEQEGLVRNVGVENLRVDMNNPVKGTEEHADSCIAVVRAEDAWVRDVSTLHFKHAGVIVRRSTRVTVTDVSARQPRSEITGRRRYNFNAAHMAQLVLFENLWATEARHAFVSGGQATSSGNVWVDCLSDYAYKESGGHAKWSQGLLYDNVEELLHHPDPDQPELVTWVLNLHNRESAGEEDNQGWSSVYSVLWNCTIDAGKTACVQKPPTSQNFAIGTTGMVDGVNWYPGNPTGYIEPIEPIDKPGLLPVSLYRAQLAERTGMSVGLPRLTP
jgi:hypothetical protein